MPLSSLSSTLDRLCWKLRGVGVPKRMVLFRKTFLVNGHFNWSFYVRALSIYYFILLLLTSTVSSRVHYRRTVSHETSSPVSTQVTFFRPSTTGLAGRWSYPTKHRRCTPVTRWPVTMRSVTTWSAEVAAVAAPVAVVAEAAAVAAAVDVVSALAAALLGRVRYRRAARATRTTAEGVRTHLATDPGVGTA